MTKARVKVSVGRVKEVGLKGRESGQNGQEGWRLKALMASVSSGNLTVDSKGCS